MRVGLLSISIYHTDGINIRLINLPKTDCKITGIHPIVYIVFLDLVKMLENFCQSRGSTGTRLETRRYTTHQNQSSQCSIMGIG